MTRLLIAALVLMLAACGGRSERADRGADDLAGVGGFLQRAFAGRSDDAAPPEGGGLCGDPYLVGEEVGDVPGPGVCGIENAVRVTSASGVTLSQPATLHCSAARALRTWVDASAKPAFGKRGGGLSELQVAAHYVCRTRNHKPGAKISEHGKGRAIDISAFRLADGTEISLISDWGRGENGKALKSMWEGACGPFGTVLGPGSDGYHENHFHFDTASYRGGPYCR